MKLIELKYYYETGLDPNSGNLTTLINSHIDTLSEDGKLNIFSKGMAHCYTDMSLSTGNHLVNLTVILEVNDVPGEDELREFLIEPEKSIHAYFINMLNNNKLLPKFIRTTITFL